MSRRFEATDPILALSPEAPFPPVGGGAMRTACVLHFLAELGPLHLILFAEEGRLDPREALPDGLAVRADLVRLPRHGRSGLNRSLRNLRRLARSRPPLFDRFSTPESMRRVAEIVKGRRFSLAVVEHFWCADYIRLLRDKVDFAVLDLHNIESALHDGCASVEPFPRSWAHRRFARHSRRLEAELLPQYDMALATSSEDAARVEAAAPGLAAPVVPNAIPLTAVPRQPEREMIAFSGNLEYHPNASAVRWFAAEIWPRLREKHPGLTWRLIGKNEEQFRPLAASDDRIELSGPVDDALEELARARIVVAPLLAGSGTRVKIMEAWAAVRPVVSTPIGAEGLPFRDGENLLLADSPTRWLEQTARLLEDGSLRQRVGANGRETFEEHCCWPAAWRALERALASPRPRSKSGEAVSYRSHLA